jgi:phage major head subunit gpT-like protein
MSRPFNMVSGDAKRALEEFSSAFDAGLVAAESEAWSKPLGYNHSSNAIRTTFPIPISAAGYTEFKGDPRMRRLYARSVDIEPVIWQDGVEELASIIEAPDFIGWTSEPANMAREAKRQPDILVAALLEANANLGFYRDRNLGTNLNIPLFADAHPVNIFDSSFGTFDNNLTGLGNDLDQALMVQVFLNMRNRKAANGRKMRLSPKVLLCHPDKEQECKDFLESDLMRLALLEVGANTNQLSNNRWKNAVQLVVGDELETAANLYFIDTAASVKPWITLDGGEIETVTFDKDSDSYKRTRMVGFSSFISCAATGLLPHPITRVVLS